MHWRQSAGRMALGLAGCYAVSAGLYIVLSGRLASALTSSQEGLARVEAMKGIAFVAITSVLLWFLTRRSFQRLLDSEKRAEDLQALYVERERQATGDVLAASVVHDINNVLTALGQLATLLRLEESPSVSETAEDLVAVNKRLHQLVGRISRFGGNDPALPERLDLAALVRETIRIASSHARVRGNRIEVDLPDHLEFHGHPLLIHQALFNLVLNAADANGAPGRLLVRAGLHEDGDLQIEVHDEGPGIPEADRRRVLDPFVTTKAKGSGLGMVSVTSCAMAHGGRVRIGESIYGGALVALELQSLVPA